MKPPHVELLDLFGNWGRFSMDIPVLTLEEGRIYTIMGANGSGKTTLLNLLALQKCPAQGVYRYRGEAVDVSSKSRVCQIRKEMAYLVQFPYMFHKSGYENIALPLVIQKKGRAEIRDRVERIIEELNISSFVNQDVQRLSGGQKQLIALARVFVTDAGLYLLDEPASGLDEEYSEVIERWIIRLAREKNATVVLATHDAIQNAQVPVVSILLQHGRIRNEADPSSRAAWPSRAGGFAV